MLSTLPKHDIVLLGVGHTNAHVLRMWRMSPIPDARLICVSNFPAVTYSGMLPGVLSGQYSRDRMEIDLVRLCSAVGARLIVGEVTGLNVDDKTLQFADRPPLPFDVLSIGIGSVPNQAGTEIDDTVLAIKPMQTFLSRLEQRLCEWQEKQSGEPFRATVVGAGVGGVEIAFCLPAGIRRTIGDVPTELTLINANAEIPIGTSAKTQQKVQSELETRGIRVVSGQRVTAVERGTVSLQNGEQIVADLVLWATGATAAPLLSQMPLPQDDRGFLLTRETLQSTADIPVFAVGDTGTIQGGDIPKAGVYAVRQGPVLWENLQRTLRGEPLQPYVPQSGFLKLLKTGDGRAIAEYKGMSVHARWCWRLKDRIDGRFMAKYQNYEPMPMQPADSDAELQMRCAGCGGKVGGSVLSRVLDRLEIPSHENVKLGLDRPDDAAIVQLPNGRPMTVTVDFFSAPFDDPYLFGRIAALNAASDLFAMGAKPFSAMAMVMMPVGPERKQEQLLYELLAGSLQEFREMDTALIGGHTIEGSQITAGFTMLADQVIEPVRTKDRLQTGDALLLTKPLGSGILLAAHMRAKCKSEWFGPLLDAMLSSNATAAGVAEEFDIAASTDVTGFGLAGHLLEMLEASHVACELQLNRIPLLPGVAELLAEGIESTLTPANRVAEQAMQFTEKQHRSPEFQALFDPQTCGGLLLAVPEQNADEVCRKLRERNVPARIIGHVLKATDGPQIIVG